MATRKLIIKTNKGDISRDDFNFWENIYKEYLRVKDSGYIAKYLNIDIRMLNNIFKEHGFVKLKSSESRTGKIKKDFIESSEGEKYLLDNKIFWNNVYNYEYIQCNMSEVRICEKYKISRKQLQRVFKYYNYPPKTKEQIKQTIKTSNNIYFGSDNASENIDIKKKISQSHINKIKCLMLARLEDYGYEIIGDYLGTRVFNTGGSNSTTWNKYKLKHKTCGTIFEDNLMRVPRCTKCYNTKSQAEDNVKLFIESLGFNTDKIKLSNGLEVDIFIPELNIGFEYNGTIWHSGKYNMKTNYHKDKTEYALSEGIKLYHIWEHQDYIILKSKILNVLGKNNCRLYARNCDIKLINFETSDIFYKSNHTSGGFSSLFNLGLYNNTELVSSMSFRRSKDNTIELVRFCSKLNTSVVGGFSKLLKHSIKYIKQNYPNINKIVTFGYRDWCPDYRDSVYYKNGFTFIKYCNPSLNYYKHSSKKIHNRQKFMKYKLKELFPETYDENLTEKEILEKNGIYTIYDSGTIRFELDI